MRRSISALKFICLLLLIFAAGLLSGCSRASLNAQIAESIGTLGMYENNEPVETPKMKAEREMQQTKESEQSDIQEHLTRAARLAASYDYSSALEELALIDEDHQADEDVLSAKIEYQRQQGLLVQYSGSVAHFSVRSLIADESRAFDGDDLSYYYNNWMLTTEEFKEILQSLYEKNYILMDIHDMVVEVENEDGTTSFALNMPLVPKGKTPIVLSFVEANYYDSTQGNGFSTRMVLDDEGKVQNEYTDASGKTQVGAYDVVSIVDEFVEEHPDFSLRGAKGIVSLTGYEGAFGYGVETGGSTITQIANALKENGWLIACHGYDNVGLQSDVDYDGMVEDIETWQKKIGSLVGDTDLLIYPYGDEVSVGTEKHAWLLEQGFRYFFSLWATYDYIEVTSDYVRQTRRSLDGYDLYYYKEDFSDFFDADAILDASRPAFE